MRSTRPTSFGERLRPALLCVLVGLAPLPACERGSSSSPAGAAEPASATAALTPDDPLTPALLEDVRYLAADELQGRESGSSGAAQARAYIVARFRDLGLAPAYAELEQPFAEKVGSEDRTGVNVVARLNGSDPMLRERFIVVSAHYDHLGVRRGEIYNGADDNASGVAALLAIAAELVAHPLGHSVLFAAFDGEEHGLTGSRSFVAAPPVPIESVALDINLDMMGRSDGNALWAAGSAYDGWLVEPLQQVATRSAIPLRLGHDRAARGQDDWTDSSDHSPFHALGIPFVYFGVEDHPDYHRPTDDWQKIDAPFLAAGTRAVIDCLRTLDHRLETR